jgi:tetratricopeptide (TPR) repeat protein
MDRKEIKEKLKLLGILNSDQLIKKDLNFWYLKKFKDFKNDQEKKIIINEAKENLDRYKKKQLIEVLNSEDSPNEYDNKNKSNYANDSVNEQKYLNEENIYSKALDFYEEKNYEKAKEYFKSTINSANFEDYTNQEKAVVYSYLGNTLRYLGDYKEAFNTFTESIKLDPKESIIYYNRALNSVDNQQLNNALDDLNTAISFNKKDLDFYHLRAEVKQALEKYDDALKDIEIAINKNPNETKFKELKNAIIDCQKNKQNEEINSSLKGCGALLYFVFFGLLTVFLPPIGIIFIFLGIWIFSKDE